MHNSSRRWHSPRPLAWLAVLTAVALMGGLGIWQLQRLGEKEALLAEIAQQGAKPPAPLPQPNAELTANGFRKFAVTGTFLHEYEIHLAARYFRGALGYHILTPLRLDDGRLLLVNRGWVPAAKKESVNRPETLIPGPQSLVVMLRTDRDHTPFTPDHDIKDNIWFWRDIPEIRKRTGLDLLPVSADVVAPAIDRTVLPIAGDGSFDLRNDHLGYAITWFLVGLSGAIVFFFFHYRKPDDADL